MVVVVALVDEDVCGVVDDAMLVIVALGDGTGLFW